MTIHFASEDSSNTLDRTSTAILKGASVTAPGLYRSFFKRFLDVSLTLIALPLTIPLILLSAVLIAMDGHNPFYSQMRIGRDGRIFRMWKLRTMVWDAEARLQENLSKNPAARAEWNRTQKLKEDPRITVVGRFLRKTSMDELPQLWNVLTGSMSLVGPRPMMVCQRQDYKGHSYFNLQPGITGLWQVSARNSCEFSGRVYYDDLYDVTLSLKTDIGVLLRTVSVVLRGTGY